MKTLEEIRQYRDDLRTSLFIPCDCVEKGHDDECEKGRLMITMTIDQLSWVIGENNQHQELVDHIHDECTVFRCFLREKGIEEPKL